MPICRYVDDLFLDSFEKGGEDVKKYLLRAVGLLGFVLEREKSQIRQHVKLPLESKFASAGVEGAVALSIQHTYRPVRRSQCIGRSSYLSYRDPVISV